MRPAAHLRPGAEQERRVCQTLRVKHPGGRVTLFSPPFLGWTLDAFDFFILAFVLGDVAQEFHTPVSSVALAITLTLACRAVGAYVFGRLADRYGRRPTLMAQRTVLLLAELLSGFAPSLTVFLILRRAVRRGDGRRMGRRRLADHGEHPGQVARPVSGLLQAGYPCGYLLAALLYLAEPWLGWRGMFMVGVIPALLVLYIRSNVPESPDWLARSAAEHKVSIWTVLRQHSGLVVFAAILMMGFNFFSHGSQDLYPSQFLGAQHKLSHGTISLITIIANVGAMLGGLGFGALSQKIGRRWAIIIAALLACRCCGFGPSRRRRLCSRWGAFLMQICVQGAWGVVRSI